MIRLVEVNAKNIWDILKLQVSEAQKSFVAPNDLSIIEAYISITGNGHAFPFGIFDEEVPVGFLMVGFDVDDSFENPPQIAYGYYSIWRLMIDEKFQNKGYGRAAMELALDLSERFRAGKRNIAIYHMSRKMKLPRNCMHNMVSLKMVKWMMRKL